MKFRHSFIKTNHNDGIACYRCDNINAQLLAGDSILKVSLWKDGAKRLPTYNTIGSLSPVYKEEENSFQINNVTIQLDANNFLLSYYIDGRRLFADRGPLAYNFENEFGNGSYHYITREENEKIYGLGDKGGTLNKAGRSFKFEAVDAMGYDASGSDPLYKHIPFYICENSVGCYGIFYDTSATAYIDLGREHNNYYEPYKYFQCDSDELTYYVFFGTKLEILQRFSRLCGRQAFPPKWSFDYCASTMAYTDSPNACEEMNAFLEKLKKYDLSCKGFYLSSGYTSIGNQRCVFNWNNDKFPDPYAFVQTFKANGIEIIPNIKPAFLESHPMYAMLSEKGYFIKNPDATPFVTQFWDGLGSYLDFTNKKAFDFWKEQVTEKLLRLGITGTWNDNNEFDIKDPEAVASGFDGTSVQSCLIRPTLTYLMNKASYEAQTEHYPHLRPFLSTRSGGIGVRRFSQTWSGDNRTAFKDLRYCHNIGLTMSMSGLYFYGHDLGGFSGEMPSRELLLRWLQHGIFEPRFTIHSWNADGSATMPWSYPDIIDAVRTLFAQRKQLVPYLYNCAYNAVHKDIPINAPLFLYYDDEEIDREGNTFLLGQDILAACIFDEGKDTVDVTLPKVDDWYLGNKRLNGGDRITLKIPAYSPLPYFVRAGSVLPTDEAEYGFNKEEKLLLTVYPLAQGQFETELFFDDGISYDYLNNHCAKLKLTVNCVDSEVLVSVTNSGDMDIDYDLRLCTADSRRLIIKQDMKDSIK